MKPLEMIAEWRKGCTVAGPMHSHCFPDGDPLPAGYCVECTEGLIDALERVLRQPNPEMIDAAIEGFNGGLINALDNRNPRGFVTYYRPKDAMQKALCASGGADQPGCARCGALPIRDNLDGDDLCQACCDKWAQGERPES